MFAPHQTCLNVQERFYKAVQRFQGWIFLEQKCKTINTFRKASEIFYKKCQESVNAFSFCRIWCPPLIIIMTLFSCPHLAWLCLTAGASSCSLSRSPRPCSAYHRPFGTQCTNTLSKYRPMGKKDLQLYWRKRCCFFVGYHTHLTTNSFIKFRTPYLFQELGSKNI